jgi:hypothetical protein
LGQRVNIQYSVELEELDAEVNRLFDNAIKELNALSGGWGIGYVPLDLQGIKMIDELRQKLARIDIALGDVQNIVQGYVHYKTSPAQEVVPESTSEEVELEMEEFEDRIAKFKEMFSAEPNQESEEENK